MSSLHTFLLFLFISMMGSSPALTQTTESPSSQLRHEIKELSKKTFGLNYPSLSNRFLFGAFCALWAQNTRRRSWLWFFLGLLFTYIPVAVLLFKNSADNAIRHTIESIRRKSSSTP